MKNRAFVKYKKTGEIVPGSLIITQGGYPKGGPYKEITMDLCCDANPCPTVTYGDWNLVTGGIAGDGTALVDGNEEFTIIGPNDENANGWVYLTRFFPLGAELNIHYNYSTFDGLVHDYPVYWSSLTEPTGVPDDLTNRATNNPEEDTWNVTVNPGTWFAIGLYSDDSCCGRGFLSINFNL